MWMLISLENKHKTHTQQTEKKEDLEIKVEVSATRKQTANA